ncbi:MAG: cupin, partial [Alphaproteobacteria bacterium]
MFSKMSLGRSLALVAGLTIAAFGAPAYAGECPADQAGSNPLADRMTTPSGVSDTVLGAIDLAAEPANIQDRQFRIRRLEIQPGGVVPFHSHEDRPALIY